jgi:protein arginine kinase activator
MKCQLCGAADARVFIQQSNASGRSALAVCAACARRRGLVRLDGDLTASVKEILASAGAPVVPVGAAIRCPRCAARLSELRKRGGAGCPACWDRFGDALYGDRPAPPAYSGRLPKRLEAARRQRGEIGEAERRLGEALAAEDYESAARWRDRLRRLGGGGADA